MSTVASYADFDLRIAPTATGYGARVLRSPAGEAYGEFALPFHTAELSRFFWLPARALRHLSPASASTAQAPLDPREFGTRLYDAVFAGAVGSVFRRGLDAAARERRGLRIRLRVQDVPELADWPWEYLYASDLDRFLALSRHTPIVRYLELDQPTPALAASPPLTIVAIVSDPVDAPPLALAREWSLLQTALQGLIAQGLIVLERLEAATLAALQARLRGDPIHILHFMGHGFYDTDSDSGGVVFEDETGNSRRVSAGTLSTLCLDHPALRLVLLNACEGARGGQSVPFAGVAQRLVQQGVPAVVGMQFPVTDDAALALAQEFYRALADGTPVDAALSEARKAVFLREDSAEAQTGLSRTHRLEWGTPVLYSRAPDGVLFVTRRATDRAGEHEMDESRPPWWEQVSAERAATGRDIQTGDTQGDVIIANVGAGARNVAVGKQIVQQVYAAVGEPTPDDKQIIQQQLAAVQTAVQAALNSIDPAPHLAQIAEFQLQLLEAELSKTEPDAVPSANTIVQVGNWLLENIPDIAETLAGVFATPAVGRVVGKAGAVAVDWIKQRFGK